SISTSTRRIRQLKSRGCSRSVRRRFTGTSDLRMRTTSSLPTPKATASVWSIPPAERPSGRDAQDELPLRLGTERISCLEAQTEGSGSSGSARERSGALREANTVRQMAAHRLPGDRLNATDRCESGAIAAPELRRGQVERRDRKPGSHAEGCVRRRGASLG